MKHPIVYIGKHTAGVGRVIDLHQEQFALRLAQLKQAVSHAGKEYGWEVRLELHSLTDGKQKVKTLRHHYCSDKAEAKQVFAHYDRLIKSDQARSVKQQGELKRTAGRMDCATPIRFEPVSTDDLQKSHAAILRALSRQYPRTIRVIRQQSRCGMSNTQSAQALASAYLADVAALTGEVIEPTTHQAARAIGEALLAFADEPAQADGVDLHLAFNFYTNNCYCYKKPAEVAVAVNAQCGTHLTAGAVRKRWERLGLNTKRLPGPDGNFA